MKSKLFLKASSLVCALALLVTGIHTAFAADRDYTLKKAFTIENAASANAVKLYEVRNNALAGTGNVTVEGSSVKYTATQDYVSFLGALTELDGVDLTASDVEIDEWSYKIVGTVPADISDNTVQFGYLNGWTEVGSSVTKTDEGYSVTNGNTTFSTVLSNVLLDEYGYTCLKINGSGFSWAGNLRTSAITIADDNATVKTTVGANHNAPNGVFWKGAPEVLVSYVNNGDGSHKYTVKAVNSYTKSDGVYTKAEDKVLISFDVTDGSAQDTGLVLLGTGRYFSKKASSVDFTDITVKYNKNIDYTAECEQFLTDNSIVEKLYNGTFAPTKDTADTLKAQLNTALSQYKEFEEDEKTVFDNNFPSFESKVSAALKECNRAAYGKFTADSQVTVTADEITSLETKDYVEIRGNNSATAKTMFTSSGNTVKYTNSQNYSIGIGAITNINGVDMTADNVAVKEWSYTITADDSDKAKIGFLESWNYIKSDDVYVLGLASNTSQADGYTGLNIGIAGIKTAYYGGKATYNSETSSWDYEKLGLPGYIYNNSYQYYWLGAPKFNVAYTVSGEGEHTYTVYATDIYTLTDGNYSKTDDVCTVKKVIKDNSEAALDFVMIAGGSYQSNNKDMVISNINVKYTIEEDITDRCVAVLEAGNGMIDRLDGIVTKANADKVAADVAELKAAYEGASAEVKNAIDAKYADVAAKIAYAEKYAYVAANKASPELKGINIKKVTSASASDLRFAVGYSADDNTDYTVAGYGAVVVLNQALEDKDAELTKDTAVKSGMENYFFDVYEEVTEVPVDNQGQFYVTITGSKGKPGTLIDCRPYIVYTDGDNNEFVLYASNDDADKNISNGQASKCGIFAARDLSNAMINVLGEYAVYPDGYTKESYDAIISKIGNEPTTSAEKNVVFQFLYENCDAYVKALG